MGTIRIAFSPSGERLASGGWMGKVHLWSVPDGDRIAVLRAHHSPRRGLGWIGRHHLLSASVDGKIVGWDLRVHRKRISLKTEQLNSVALLKSPARIIVGYSSGHVRLFSYPAFQTLAEIETGSKILSVATSPQNDYIAGSMCDGRVWLLDSCLRRIREMENPGQQVRELRFSPDGQQLAGGGWFKLVLWDRQSGAIEVRHIEHRGAIVSLDYDPSGEQLATIGRYTDASLRRTAVDDGMLLRRLTSHPLCGWSVRYSPDGRYLASSSEDGSIHVYNVDAPYRSTWHDY